MLKSFTTNIPLWLVVRLLELAILYCMHTIYFCVNEEPLGAALYQSAYYTAVYAYTVYVYLGYALLQLTLLALVSVGWKLKLTCPIAYVSPVYVPISIFLSGSLPNADPLYLLRSPFFLAALVLAVLVNVWGYRKLCSRSRGRARTHFTTTAT